MALMKSEFLHQYNKKNGIDFKSKLFGSIHKQNKLGMLAPGLVNFMFKNKVTSKLIKSVLGVALERSLPPLNNETFRRWFAKQKITTPAKQGSVFLFVDEFTNYNDLEIGKKTVLLLSALGYQVNIIKHEVSARTYISKGMLKEAKACAQKNVNHFYPLISQETPLIGIEPSAILTFRDEYPKLLRGNAQEHAKTLSKHCYTIEEFLSKASENIDFSTHFTTEAKLVKVHVHCHQKALSQKEASKRALELPANFKAQVIDSSCCGMAGSFGYEKEHYGVSMQMGELKLFPAVREASHTTIIAAAGTSCRHQIKDGTEREAQHPVEVLYDALIS